MANAVPLAKKEPKRSYALDALRGFAILTMVLSGAQPSGVLPDWMYHAQTPPPTHQFDGTLPGITWVDLVFPFFLFALGAAIPLALGCPMTLYNLMTHRKKILYFSCFT